MRVVIICTPEEFEKWKDGKSLWSVFDKRFMYPGDTIPFKPLSLVPYRFFYGDVEQQTYITPLGKKLIIFGGDLDFLDEV